MSAAETRYCPSCGQDVPVEQVLDDAYLLTGCSLCGLGLGIRVASADEIRRLRTPPAQQRGAEGPGGPALGRVGVVRREMAVGPVVERPGPADPRAAVATPADSLESASTPGMPAASAETPPAGASAETPPAGASAETPPAGASAETSGNIRQMRRVVVVEDSTFLREVTRDLLTERGLAREVVDLPDGATFLEDFTRSAAAGRKPDLVILDVRMPGMDGRDAAYAMRAIEAGFGLKRTPILFFSAVLCDEAFKATLAALRNAKYIRKADGGDARELGARIAAVLERLVGARR